MTVAVPDALVAEIVVVLLPPGVDLVVLNGAPLELAGRIALHGLVLFDDDPPARIRWTATTRKIYADEEAGCGAVIASSLRPSAVVDEVRILRLLRSISDDLVVLRADGSADPARWADALWLRGVKYTFVTAIEAAVDGAQHVSASQGVGPAAGQRRRDSSPGRPRSAVTRPRGQRAPCGWLPGRARVRLHRG